MGINSDEPRKRRIGPIMLAICIPGAGYFALGHFGFGFGCSIAMSALGYASLLGAASGNAVMLVGAFAAAIFVWLGSVVHVGLALRNAGRTPRTLVVVVATLALLIVGEVDLNLYRRTLCEAFRIPSGSMIPTLQVGDHLLVDKRAVAPKRGDVIVFNSVDHSGRQFIKRCMAIGGDTVEMRDDIPVVNGVPVARKPIAGLCAYDDYDEQSMVLASNPCLAFDETIDGRTFRIYQNPEPPALPQMKPTTVPSGGCFTLGDNRDNSYDSRFFGPVPAENIVGTARLIWWGRTPERIGRPVR